MAPLIGLLTENEDAIVQRLIAYASEHGYARYTPTLVEAWRASVAGLTRSLATALEGAQTIPTPRAEENFLQDPAAVFGVTAARNHRKRGVTIAQFLGLMKIYRQSYLDVLEAADSELDGYQTTLHRFFDRVELGFCTEWINRSSVELGDELRSTNRDLANEKNLYLTLMEGLNEPVFWLDRDLVIQYANHAAARMFRAAANPGSVRYGGHLHGTRFPWAADRLAVMLERGDSRLETAARVETDEGDRQYVLRARSIPDVSNKFTGLTVVAEDVTEREAALAALRESENRLRGFFDSSNEGIALHEIVYDKAGSPVDYRVVAANAAFEAHTGIAVEKAVCRRATDVYGQSPPPFLDVYARVAEGGTSERFEIYYEPLHRHYRISVFSPGPGQFATIFSDISASKRTELELRRAVDTTQGILRAAPVAIGMVQDRVFQWVSERMCEMTGYTAAELLGQSARMLYPDDEEFLRVGSDKYGQLRHRGVGTVETTWLHRGGDPIRIQLCSSPLDPEDLGTGVIFTALDITRAKRLEEKQRQLEQQFQRTQKLESLGVLAGGIAHDFNNMLVAILGNADLALSELPVHSPARSRLTDIDSASRKAADLCLQLLAYSGKGKFVVEKVGLTELVEQTIQMLQVSVSKTAELRLRLGDNVPPVEADATQLRQILMNLVINASEAIEGRSGAISITTGTMDCSKDYLATTFLNEELAPGVYSYFEVSDTGKGMDEATRERIFEPFFTTKLSGRGLGMAAVLGIVRGHGGGIKVYSEPGNGTTVKVLLPSVVGATADPAFGPEAGTAWKGEGTVLLVDDEDTVRAVAKQMLEKLGFDVLVAADGQEAVELYCAAPDRVTAVLMDLTMPHMGGEEAFAQLRLADPEVRVIFSSGYNEQDVTQRFAGKGMAGFVQKPYRTADLRKALRKLLG